STPPSKPLPADARACGWTRRLAGRIGRDGTSADGTGPDGAKADSIAPDGTSVGSIAADGASVGGDGGDRETQRRVSDRDGDCDKDRRTIMSELDFDGLPGVRFSALAYDVDSGDRVFAHNEDDELDTASMGKVFLLHTALQMSQDGTLDLQERLTRRPSERVDE